MGLVQPLLVLTLLATVGIRTEGGKKASLPSDSLTQTVCLVAIKRSALRRAMCNLYPKPPVDNCSVMCAVPTISSE